MNSIKAKFEVEKASQRINVRVTPTQFNQYHSASGGNVSGWLKNMANAKCAKARGSVVTQKNLSNSFNK